MATGPGLHTADVLGTSPTGAIVGEEVRSPFAALLFGATEILTTEDLGAYETPDVGSLDGFTVEIWYLADPVSPAGGDLIMCGPAVTGGVIRQWWLTHNADNTVTFSARNTTPSTVSVTSAFAVVAATWYHLVGRVYGGFLNLWINGVEAASTAWTGQVQASGMGAGSSNFFIGDPSGAVAHAADEVAVYRYGLADDRIREHYEAGRNRGFIQALTGTRIGAVIDLAETVAARDLDTGTRQVTARYMQGQPPLDEIRAAVSAESIDAIFFTARDGTLTFLDSDHRSASPHSTVQATFDDDGTDLSYHELGLDYSEAFLSNEWSVTRASFGAETQTVTDTTSVAKYLKRPSSVTGIPVVDDTECLTIATAMLAKYKEPLTRVTSITLSTSEPAVTEAVFRREIGDRIRVFRTPPGGGSRIDQTLFIQKIQVDATPTGPWRIVWAVSPV